MNQFKTIASTITIPYGVMKNLPQSYTTEQGVVVAFEAKKNNVLEMYFDFSNSNFGSEDGLDFAIKRTNNMADSISLQQALSTQRTAAYTMNWAGQSFSERHSETSGQAWVEFPNDMTTESYLGLEKHRTSLDFFNQALHYSELSGKEKEVGFWLYFSYEALLVELYHNKKGATQKLEKYLDNTEITNMFNSYKNSIGRYYRHFETAYDGEILGIDECIKIHQKLLSHFVKIT